MKKFSECLIVENYIVQKLAEKEWTFLPADGLLRESYLEPLLITNLITALEKIN